MNWTHRKVLVTGADGFIGSHLTERLVELGADTRAFIFYTSTGTWGWLDSSDFKNNIEIFIGDIRDPDTLRQAMRGIDVVFHLAALIAIPYSYQAPLSYIRTNVEGTFNVLQAAREAGVKLVVHTSTSEVYGTARYVPINEEHPLQAQSPYAASKIAADKLAESFYLSYGLPVATARPFNTFGPRQSARAIIPTIITQALTRPEIRLGNTEPTRDFNFVADTVGGFIRMAEGQEKAAGEVVNFGSGKEISIGSLASKVIDLLGVDKPVICDNRRTRPTCSEVERLCADSNKAKRLFNWEPSHTLDSGLIQTIEWIEKNVEKYHPEVYAI